jgi:hypothetical protein
MGFQLLANRLAMVAIACILGLFLFPAAHGPYSAVHGPVTALGSLRAGTCLRWAIAAAALGRLGYALVSLLFLFLYVDLMELVIPSFFSPGYGTILRC